MSIAELIAQKACQLSGELQQAVRHYVDYLLARQQEATEASDWARFSAEQLAAQHAPEDSIYDAD